MKRFIVELIITVNDDGSVTMERSCIKQEVEQTIAGPTVRIRRIHLERAEGVRTAQTADVDSFDAADSVLKSWSRTAPKENFHKIDFTLTFDDGNTFVGDYELSASDQNNPDILARHVRAFVRQQMESDSNDRAKYRHFWGTYDIGQGGLL